MRRFFWGLVILGLLSAAAPAAAQEYVLFDKFNIKFEGSWVKLNTVMRIDSKTLGKGASLSFEDAICRLFLIWQLPSPPTSGFYLVPDSVTISSGQVTKKSAS